MRFDWAALLAAGAREAALRPCEFWGLTPFELAVVLGRDPGRQPMSRRALAALARAWPDQGDADDG